MPKFNLNWIVYDYSHDVAGTVLTNESGSASKNIPYDEFPGSMCATAI